MEIYKKLDTSIKIKESNSLDFVSENILGLKKIKVEDIHGKPISLQKLYETDFERFIYYNTIDSVLVQLIHFKMRYIEIIFGISAVAKISAMDTFSVRGNGIGSLAITEGVLRDRFREMHNVIFFKQKNNTTNQILNSIEGGYVKEPVRGMNRWVACYDFASLYPTTQRQFFISPENYLGILDGFDNNYYVDFLTSDKKLIIPDEMVVLSNGCVFFKRKSATIDMLECVYKERKADKKISLSERELMEFKINQLDILKKEIEMEM
jgi:DNA polymerase elongation subunit (family B)